MFVLLLAGIVAYAFANPVKMDCALVDCAMPNCVDAVTNPGECCETCPNGPNCWHGKIKVSGDTSHLVNSHTMCSCPSDITKVGTNGPQAHCWLFIGP